MGSMTLRFIILSVVFALVLSTAGCISITFSTSKDIVRHPLVAKILNAYEKHEQGNQN